MRPAFPALVTTYALFVGMVLLARRRPMPRPRDVGEERLERREVTGTILGGYIVFLAIVVVFHVWLAGDGDAFVEALWGVAPSSHRLPSVLRSLLGRCPLVAAECDLLRNPSTEFHRLGRVMPTRRDRPSQRATVSAPAHFSETEGRRSA